MNLSPHARVVSGGKSPGRGFLGTNAGGRLAVLHGALIRLAGWAPDDMISSARRWLADGRVVDVAKAVSFVVQSGAGSISVDQARLVAEILGAADVDPDGLIDLDHDELVAMPGFTFSPSTGLARTARCIDLTAPTARHHRLDTVDLAAMAAAGETSGGAATVAGLWRSWRRPALATPWPPPRRVYLVQAITNEPDLLPMITLRVQLALVRVGEANPQVESFLDPAELAAYQRAALARSALLWAGRAMPAVEIARLFDPADQVGPSGFVSSRHVLDEADRADMLSYLDNGSPLWQATASTDDVVDRRRVAVVPMGFRTDGTWIWPEAAAYYLRHHAIAPDADLLSHARSVGFRTAVVDAVARHRAMAALQRLRP